MLLLLNHDYYISSLSIRVLISLTKKCDLFVIWSSFWNFNAEGFCLRKNLLAITFLTLLSFFNLLTSSLTNFTRHCHLSEHSRSNLSHSNLDSLAFTIRAFLNPFSSFTSTFIAESISLNLNLSLFAVV